MLVSVAPFEMDGQNYLVLYARDVSESERTRLVHSAILENASIGIALPDANVGHHGNITLAGNLHAIRALTGENVPLRVFDLGAIDGE